MLFLFVYFVLRYFLSKISDRVAKQIEQSVGQVQKQVSQQIQARGAVLSEPWDAKTTQLAQGVSAKIRSLADAKGIDLNQAKVQFFKRTEKMAKWMDHAIELPVVGGIGLDAPLGWFIPIVGDLISKGFSVVIIINSLQYGIPKPLLNKMVANAFIDVLIGWIPLLGNVFDVFFRANKRNVQLLKDYLEESRGLLQTPPET